MEYIGGKRWCDDLFQTNSDLKESFQVIDAMPRIVRGRWNDVNENGIESYIQDVPFKTKYRNISFRLRYMKNIWN